jgi:gluconolactonase
MTYRATGLIAMLTTGTLFLVGCQTQQEPIPVQHASLPPQVSYPTMGKIERFDPELEAILPVYAVIEQLADGFEWSEGPVWVAEWDSLLFSDVPENKVYRWHEVGGVSVLLDPSGFTGSGERSRESGANGLTLDSQGRLVLCQHGDRRVARLEPDGRFKTLAAYYRFLRFNSPNDLVYHPNGDLYFTDPTYGLEHGLTDPRRELMFSGVFRLRPDGEVTLLTDKLTFPNGVAFAPGGHQLYVAVSDPQNPVIMRYDLNTDGTLGPAQLFFDAKSLAAEGRKGLPDGLKTDLVGNVFATGPGGVLVISPAGRLLGIINTGEATANCAWGNDGSVLYITADSYLCRVKTWTRGFHPPVLP